MKRFILFFTIFFTTFNLMIAVGNDTEKLFTLSPVPLSTNTLTVKLNSSNSNVGSFELRNLIGRRLQEKPLTTGSDMVVFNDMDMYPNGLYVVFAKDKNGKMIESVKFIINR